MTENYLIILPFNRTGKPQEPITISKKDVQTIEIISIKNFYLQRFLEK